jgi:hypothetical protein
MAVLRQNSIRPVFSIIYPGRSPLVAMMQPSDFSDLNHRSALRLSFAKTRSPLVSTTWEMGCNVVELERVINFDPRFYWVSGQNAFQKTENLSPKRRKSFIFSAQS